MKSLFTLLFVLLLAVPAFAQTEESAPADSAAAQTPAPQAKTKKKKNKPAAETADTLAKDANAVKEADASLPPPPPPKPKNNSPLGEKDSFDLVNQRVETLVLGEKPKPAAPEANVDIIAKPLTQAPPLELPPHQPEVPGLKMEKALPVPTERWEKVYNHHVKLGFGRYLTPFASVHLNGGRNTKLDWGAEIRHLSSIGGHTNYAGFNDNQARLKFSYLLRKSRVYANTAFQNYNYNSYGDSSALSVEKQQRSDTISQRFTRFEFTAGLAMDESKKKNITFDLPLRAQVYADRRQNSEFHFSLLPKFHHQMFKKISLDAAATATFSGIKRPETAALSGGSQVFFDIKPTIEYRLERFWAKGGFRLGAFTGAETSRFSVLPTIEAGVVVAPKFLTVTAYFDGGLNYLTRYDVLTENPYLNANAVLLPSKDKFKVGGALSGFFGQLNYKLGASYRAVTGMPLYFSSPTDGVYFGENARQGYFNVLYDANFTELALSGQVAYDKNGKLRIGAKIDYRVMKTSTLPAAFHLPAFRAELFGSYRILKKITVQTQFNLIGSRAIGVDKDLNVVKANFFPDWNLGVTYQISKRFGAFAEFNNLLNQRYIRWNDYVERRLDLKLGATVSF